MNKLHLTKAKDSEHGAIYIEDTVNVKAQNKLEQATQI